MIFMHFNSSIFSGIVFFLMGIAKESCPLLSLNIDFENKSLDYFISSRL